MNQKYLVETVSDNFCTYSQMSRRKRSKECREARRRYLAKKARLVSRKKAAVRHVHDRLYDRVTRAALNKPSHVPLMQQRDELYNKMASMLHKMDKLAAPHPDVPEPPPGADVLHSIEKTLDARQAPDARVNREHYITSQLLNPVVTPLHVTLEHLVHQKVNTEHAINRLGPPSPTQDNNHIADLRAQITDLKAEIAKNASDRNQVNALKQELNTQRSKYKNELTKGNVQSKAAQVIRNALNHEKTEHASTKTDLQEYHMKWQQCQEASTQLKSQLQMALQNKQATQQLLQLNLNKAQKAEANSQMAMQQLEQQRKANASTATQRLMDEQEKLQRVVSERNLSETQRSALQSRINALSQEMSVSKSELELKLSAMMREKEVLSTQAESTAKNKAGLHAELQELQAGKEALTATLQRLKASAQSTDELMVRLQEVSHQLAQRNTDLKASAELTSALTADKETLTRELAQRNTNLKASAELAAALTTNKQTLSHGLAQSAALAAALTTDKQTLSGELAQRNTMAAQQMTGLHQQIDALTLELAQRRDMEAASAESMAELSTERNTLVNSLAQRNSKLTEQTETLAEKERAMQDFQQQLEQLLDKEKETTAELERVQSTAAAQEAAAIAKLDAIRLDCAAEKNVKDKAYSDLLHAKEELETRMRQERNISSQQHNQLAGLNTELAKKTEEMQTLQAAYDAVMQDMHSQSQALTEQLAVQQRESDDAMAAAVRNKEGLQTELKNSIQALQLQVKSQTNRLEKDLDELTLEKQQMSEALETARGEAAMAQQLMHGMEAKLQRQTVSMQEETQRLVDAMREAEQQRVTIAGLQDSVQAKDLLKTALQEQEALVASLQHTIDEAATRQQAETADMQAVLASARQHEEDMKQLANAASARLGQVEQDSAALVASLQAQVEDLKTQGVSNKAEWQLVENELKRVRDLERGIHDNMVERHKVMQEHYENKLLHDEERIEILRSDKARALVLADKYEDLKKAFEEKEAVVLEQNNKLLLAESEAEAQRERLAKLEGAHEDVLQEADLARLQAEERLAEALQEATSQRLATDELIKTHAAEMLAATERLQTGDHEHQQLKLDMQQLVGNGLLDQVKLDEHQARIEQLMTDLASKDAVLQAGREELLQQDSDWKAAMALKEQMLAKAELDFTDYAKKASDERALKSQQLLEASQELETLTRALNLVQAELERVQGSASSQASNEVKEPNGRGEEKALIKSLLEELIDLTSGTNKQGYMRNMAWLEDSAHVDSILAKEAAYKQALRALKHSVYVCVIFNTWSAAMSRHVPLPSGLTVRGNIVKMQQQTYDRFYSAQTWDSTTSIHNIYEGTSERTSLKDMVEDCQRGGSSVMFTYGLSGAGKTEALFGDPQQPGLMLSALAHLESEQAVVTHHEDFCLYGRMDVPDLVAHPMAFQGDQLSTITYRTGMLTSEVLPVAGKAHAPGAPVTAQSIRQTLLNHPAIRPTPNNVRSSRGHLFMTWKVDSATHDTGFLTFVDMAGSENPKLIAEAFGVQAYVDAKRKQFTPDEVIARSIPAVRKHAFFGTMKAEYLRTDPALQRKLDVHTVLTEGFFINETLNQLSDFFQLERAQQLPTNRQFMRLDGPWSDARVNGFNFRLSVYTADMIQDAYTNNNERLDPVGLIQQLVRLKGLGQKSSVFTMVALANANTVNELGGVKETLDFAQRLC